MIRQGMGGSVADSKEAMGQGMVNEDDEERRQGIERYSRSECARAREIGGDGGSYSPSHRNPKDLRPSKCTHRRQDSEPHI